MEEEVLQELEQGGGLKEDTLARRKHVYDHFMSFWEVEGQEEIAEVFKTPEGRAKFSKISGRWAKLLFVAFLTVVTFWIFMLIRDSLFEF